jgi:hypothetical protein
MRVYLAILTLALVPAEGPAKVLFPCTMQLGYTVSPAGDVTINLPPSTISFDPTKPNDSVQVEFTVQETGNLTLLNPDLLFVSPTKICGSKSTAPPGIGR